MASPPAKNAPPRREFRNISPVDILSYRLPPGALVSILHRISGVILFVMLPFLIWLFDHSLTSELSYERFTALFDGLLGVPGWMVKLVVLGLIWAFLHHLCAGVRHLVMDVSHKLVAKAPGKKSALAVFAASIPLTLALGAKLFGLY
ncbi:MAG: succinate dehydrogenase, cytochrome b556 subunit [Brachymonas sp.]|nr:succinate dehydrogenase, cytochrome b556 subunit [Brachymonas sp.]